MIIRTLAAAAAMALAAPAFAETAPADTDVNFAFRFQPSTLSSTAGAQDVHQRLTMAANSACRKTAPSAQRGVDSACREGLIDTAVAKINNANLSAVHNSDTRVAGLNR